jgi:hypothetical protein
MNEQEYQKFLEDRNEYHSKTFVLLEIVKPLYQKELSMITPSGFKPKKVVRYLVAFSIDFLKKHFEVFNFEKYPINLYCSCATLRDIPVFTYSLIKRTKMPEYKKFNDEYNQHIICYDFFCDFDGKQNYAKCLQEALEMKNIFEEYKVPYFVQNSSFSGFHLIIPSFYMPNYKIEDLIEKIRKALFNLKGFHDFETLDISVGDTKRLRKVSYSVVADGSVVLPLSPEQFTTNFNPLDCSIRNVLKSIHIKNRGLIIRTHNLSETELKANIIKFFNDYS